MPKELMEKLQWLFLLLPGFVCISVADMIADLRALSEFQLTCYSLVAALPILLLALPLSLRIDKLCKKIPETLTGYSYFFSSLMVACILGLGLGYSIEEDILFRSLRSVPGTDILVKRSNKRPMALVLGQNSRGRLKREGDGRPLPMKRTEAFVRIRIKDGLIYEGWPEYYDSRLTPTEVYLSPACHVDGSGNVTMLHGPGVMIVEAEMQTMELVDRESSFCWMLYYFNGPPHPLL